MSSCYDLIIIGAGIAGLYTGIEVLKRYNIRCCILERSSYVGGRIFTFHTKVNGVGPLQWEAGAGRIATSHRRVRSLLKRYHLSFIPISSNSEWMAHGESKENPFSKEVVLYFDPLTRLSRNILSSHTLGELLESIHGKEHARAFYMKFPYYAEIHTLRADLALESFQHEMGSRQAFGVCGEGLSALVDAMVKEYTSLGGTLLTGVHVESVDYSSLWTIRTMESCTKKERTFQSIVCVSAVASDALSHIQGLHFPFLRHLRMAPLLRIYAVFPVSNKGESWFTNLPKIVTSSPIRYIIPIQPKKGVIMISYTDGKDTFRWASQSPHDLQITLMKEIRALFPEKNIPSPLYLKTHHWKKGCTYWLPGAYDPDMISQLSLSPMKNRPLFMCNESFAIKQAWMESSLIQAQRMMSLPAFHRALKGCVRI